MQIALATDPDVDLVVCSLRVDKHFLTIKPSIIAGKDIFVECYSIATSLLRTKLLPSLLNIMLKPL
jgi:hypothetical protein